MEDLHEMPAGLPLFANTLKLGFRFAESRPQCLNFVRAARIQALLRFNVSRVVTSDDYRLVARAFPIVVLGDDSCDCG